MSPSPPASTTIARASFLTTVAPRGVPFGPARENRNGGASPAGSAFAAVGRGVSDSVTGSASSPVRPPSWVEIRPSPSMKMLSEPCVNAPVIVTDLLAGSWVPLPALTWCAHRGLVSATRIRLSPST